MIATMKHSTLAAGQILAQGEVQRLLAAPFAASGDLDAALRNLGAWLESIGYFAHLTDTNERLSFRDDALGLMLRLQVNYSRLAYRSPAADRRVACPLCIENIGTPGKELLRVFHFALAGRPFFSHPTPFPLCEGHFVVNSLAHEPMAIGERGLRESADFVAQAQSWLVASNSDVEWAGASVLGHHHMQVFADLVLPLESAHPLHDLTLSECEGSFLDWPCPVVRLAGDTEPTLAAASRLIAAWKAIDPGKATFNSLMRRKAGGGLAIHLLFRHPDFRTQEPLRQIKSEGIGIIEMAGEVIVPPIAGKSREENRAYFEREGLAVIRGIIGQNAPWPAQWTPEWFADLARKIG